VSDESLDRMAQDEDDLHVWVVSLHHQRGFHVDHVTDIFVDRNKITGKMTQLTPGTAAPASEGRRGRDVWVAPGAGENTLPTVGVGGWEGRGKQRVRKRERRKGARGGEPDVNVCAVTRRLIV
jgi:hypothetical protein